MKIHTLIIIILFINTSLVSYSNPTNECYSISDENFLYSMGKEDGGMAYFKYQTETELKYMLLSVGYMNFAALISCDPDSVFLGDFTLNEKDGTISFYPRYIYNNRDTAVRIKHVNSYQFIIDQNCNITRKVNCEADKSDSVIFKRVSFADSKSVLLPRLTIYKPEDVKGGMPPYDPATAGRLVLFDGNDLQFFIHTISWDGFESYGYWGYYEAFRRKLYLENHYRFNSEWLLVEPYEERIEYINLFKPYITRYYTYSRLYDKEGNRLPSPKKTSSFPMFLPFVEYPPLDFPKDTLLENYTTIDSVDDVYGRRIVMRTIDFPNDSTKSVIKPPKYNREVYLRINNTLINKENRRDKLYRVRQ